MAEPKDDDKIFDKLRTDVHQMAYHGTEDAIRNEIETTKQDIRDAKTPENASWWDKIVAFLKSLMLMLAEWIDGMFGTNITGWMASMSGTPIPAEENIKSLSDTVAKSVSNAVIPQTAEDRAEIAKMQNADQFGDYVTGKVRTDLQAYKAANPDAPFSDDQLNQAATQAGQKAKEHFAGIHNLVTFNKTFADEVKKGVSEKDRENIGKLAGRDSKHPITAENLDLLAATMSSTVKGLAVTGGLPQEGDHYTHVANALRKSLKDGRAQLKNANMDFSDESIDLLADQFASKITPKIEAHQNMTQTQPSQAFLTDMTTKQTAAVKSVIARDTSISMQNAIVETTAWESVKANNEFAFLSPSTWDKAGQALVVNNKDAAIIEKYYKPITFSAEYTSFERKPGMSDAQLNAADKKELQGAQKRLYDNAAYYGKTVNNAQRKIIGDITGQVVSDILAKNSDKKLGQKELADLVEVEALKRFTAKDNKEILLKAGPLDDKDQMLTKIAKGIGNTIRYNEDGAADRILVGHTQLSDIKTQVAKAQATDPTHVGVKKEPLDHPAPPLPVAAAKGKTDQKTVASLRP